MKDQRFIRPGRRTADHKMDTYLRTASHKEIFRTSAGNMIRRRVELTAEQFDNILMQFIGAEMLNKTDNKWEAIA